MRKVTVLLVLAAVALSTSVAVAQDTGMKTSVSASYLSQYMFYGLDWFADDDQAFVPAVNVDLGNGFGLNVAGQWPLEGDGHQNMKKLDYTVNYGFSLYEDDAAQMDFDLNWTYYHLYDNSSDDADFHEFGAMVSLPNLMGVDGFAPHYRFVRFWAWDTSDNLNFGLDEGSVNGYVHMFGFNYGFQTESFMQAGQSQDWMLSMDAVFNDKFIADESGWSHAVGKLAMPFECMGGTLTPMVAYQLTFGEFDLNDEDELYWGVTYALDF